MEFEIFVTRGLGDNSYLVNAGKEAFLVDPQRDAWRFLKVAAQKGLRVTHVFETHVHNDYISGMLEIKNKTDAQIVVPATGNYEFEHLGVTNGHTLDIGNLQVEAMSTPGHTYEHTSWLVRDTTGKELSIFTGGSLIVGSAGRTDLLGDDHTEQLTKHQFHTLQKYHHFEDDIQILPTHGSGSFCTSSNASQIKISTIGNEKRDNFTFQAENYDLFKKQVLNGLKQYPSYYKFMAPINRTGPSIKGELDLPKKLNKTEFLEKIRNGTYFIDARDRNNYARLHLKNSINIELVPSFCSYVGWLIPFNAPIMLLVDSPEEDNLIEAITQLFRIGYTNIEGYIPNSNNLEDLGLPTNSYEVISFKEVCKLTENTQKPYLLDVRQEIEFQTEGKLKNSHNIFVTDLMLKQNEISETLTDEEVITYCASGQRAVIAASILARRGVNVKVIGDGGIDELLLCQK